MTTHPIMERLFTKYLPDTFTNLATTFVADVLGIGLFEELLLTLQHPFVSKCGPVLADPRW